MQNVSSTNKLNTLGYEEKEIVMNSERLLCFVKFLSFPRKGKRWKEGKTQGIAVLGFEDSNPLFCYTCLENAAASYSLFLCHRQAVSFIPNSTIAFQAVYTSKRMENSRKEKSNLIETRMEVFYERERQEFWLLKWLRAIDKKTLGHRSLDKTICCSYKLHGMQVYLESLRVKRQWERPASAALIEITLETNPN